MSAPLIALLCPDLLFGSKLQASLTAAGYEVVSCAGEPAVAAALETGALLLIADLTDEPGERIAIAARAVQARGPQQLRVLGFYSHVEPQVRSDALAAGLDLVVPRSKINREAAQLVAQLLAG